MDIRGVLGPGGALESKLPTFKSRAGQLEMAENVGAAIAARDSVVLEAGTGLGKTYAYLVPLMLSGAKALVSTGTKNLQDQLFGKDLPELAGALGMRPEVRVLKGRKNYLCKLRYERLQANPELLGDNWEPVEMFARDTADGDLDGLESENIPKGQMESLASTRESCPARDCEHYGSCHFYEARRAAKSAQIAVVNHHLYLSDLSLRDSDRGEILPDSDVIVFDEAHSLPEAAVQCFGRTVSSQKMARDFASLLKELRIAMPESPAAADLEDASEAHRAMLSLLHEGRADSAGSEPVLADELCSGGKAGGGIRSFCDRIERAAERVMAIEGIPLDLKAMSHSLTEAANHLRIWMGDSRAGGRPGEDAQAEPAMPMVRWARVADKGVFFTNAPVDVGNVLGKHFNGGERAHVFTSATLSVGGSLESFAGSVGLEDGERRVWPSPFRYEECSALLVPDDMPVPKGGSMDAHAQRVVDVVCELGEANGGRAFALFTSLRAMRRAGGRLRKRLGRKNISVLIQGEESNPRLLERFRADQRCVLVGSHSFSMGVDVKGMALSLVVFDKLPFIPPNDPLLRERERLCRERGEDSFWRLQIPHAVLCLKQAAGRLIRDEEDRGVFVLCDPRLVKSGYGKLIRGSLPPMRFTRSMEDAKRVLENSA